MTGKIYIIRNDFDNDLLYIGSTFADLNYRFERHRFQKTTKLHKYITENDDNFENWFIELYEEYHDITKEDLLKREGDVIRQFLADNPKTLNKCIAGRTKQQYIIDNKDKICNIRKKYYHNHIDKFKQSYTCECGRTFRFDNKYRHLKSKYHSSDKQDYNCSPNGTSTITTSAVVAGDVLDADIERL